MIKIKYKKLLDGDFMGSMLVLAAVTDIKSPQVLIACGRIVRDIKKAAEEYNEARAKINKNFAAEPGKELPVDTKQALHEALVNLVETEFELDHKKINLKDLPHKTLSPGHIAALEDILVIS